MALPPTPPTADEVEVSLFGRGYGEALCVHLSGGEWFLVDSCIDPNSGEAASLSYLGHLGVPFDDVQLIVATHWDDDHIRGITDVARACSNARVVCSAALNQRDLLAFVFEQEGAEGALGSGLSEFRGLLRLTRERGADVIWAKANLPLHPVPPGDSPAVVALSPSENAFARSLEALIEGATGEAISLQRRRYRAPEGPNGASIATSVRVGDISVLLGADLETSTNAETGWDALIRYSKPTLPATAVKVPHHGSAGAHHDGMWNELSTDDVVAILSPWSRGTKFLPTEADLERLKGFCHRLYLTAVPSLTRAKKDAALQKMIRRLHGNDLTELRGWGQVRLRRGENENAWRVELDGDAIEV